MWLSIRIWCKSMCIVLNWDIENVDEENQVEEWLTYIFSIQNLKNHVLLYSHVYLGLRARQHLRSLAPVMKWWWPNDIRGPCGPKASWHSSHRWGKTPKKSHPGNLSRPGIKPGPTAWQARMLPLVPQWWTSTAINLTGRRPLLMRGWSKIPMPIYQKSTFSIFFPWE